MESLNSADDPKTKPHLGHKDLPKYHRFSVVLEHEQMARGVGFEPTRPFDHRLSRPAPYQARATPPSLPQPHHFLREIEASPAWFP